MGAAGSDVALDSADVALMGDDLTRLPDAINHSRRAVRIMKQNVSVSLITKAIFVVLAPLGFVSLITAIAVDMGVSLLVTLNGLRLLRRPATHSLRETPGDPDPVAGATGAEGDACEEDCCSPAVSDGKAVELPILTGNRGT